MALTKRILGIYGGLITAEALCVSAFVLEVHRALSGNSLSWAYVFEWPIFAGYAVYLARKLLREERQGPRPSAPATPEDSDSRLAEYNEYLRKVHHDDKDASDDS
jgi:hypothetical protein